MNRSDDVARVQLLARNLRTSQLQNESELVTEILESTLAECDAAERIARSEARDVSRVRDGSLFWKTFVSLWHPPKADSAELEREVRELEEAESHRDTVLYLAQLVHSRRDSLTAEIGAQPPSREESSTALQKHHIEFAEAIVEMDAVQASLELATELHGTLVKAEDHAKATSRAAMAAVLTNVHCVAMDARISELLKARREFEVARIQTQLLRANLITSQIHEASLALTERSLLLFDKLRSLSASRQDLSEATKDTLALLAPLPKQLQDRFFTSIERLQRAQFAAPA